MKIVMLRENKNVVVKTVKVSNNTFKLFGKEYFIDNPEYVYVKTLFGLKMALVYKENNKLPLKLPELTMENQLKAEILDKLIYYNALKDLFGKEEKLNDLLYLAIIFGVFIMGILIGRY